MMRSLAGSLIKYETIETTLARAKELRRLTDRLVTMGKKDSLHARRQAYKVLNDHGLVKKLFDEIAPRFKERPGGYTRLIKTRFRVGDNAPMSLVTFSAKELVKKEKAAANRATSIADEVKKGVEAELAAEAPAAGAVAANEETPAAEPVAEEVAEDTAEKTKE